VPEGQNVKPYYEHGGITIYHGSALAFVEWTRADVMISDPPYGMNYRSGWSGEFVAGDKHTRARDGVLAMWGDKPALIFGRWNLPKPIGTKTALTWDKGDWPGMGDLSLPWGPSTEEVYVLGGGFVGKRGGSILRANRLGASKSEHPTEKPQAVLRQLIAACPPGWVIVDPFMGSGSLLEAARDMGRRAIGVEIEEGYCEGAARRLQQEVLPLEQPA
jgi:site-specific DNA-methyltransferase (adenine-specific)